MFDAITSIIGFLLLVAGIPLCLYWQIRFLVVAYNYSRWWFFGCLFVPLVDWAFLLLHFKICRRPFGLSLLGLGLTVLGCWMAHVDCYSR